jgi:hypothetical protein
MLPALLALTLAGQDTAARPRDGIPDPDACLESIQTPSGAMHVRRANCITFLPQREFDGLWINDFEGSTFLEGAHVLADASVRHAPRDVWLEIERARFPAITPPLLRSHVFRVRFRGRAAAYAYPQSIAGYGHMNAFGRLVAVDEVLTIKDLGPAPPGG